LPAHLEALVRDNRAAELGVSGGSEEDPLFVAAWLHRAPHRYAIHDANRVTLIFFMRRAPVSFSAQADQPRTIEGAGPIAVLAAGTAASWVCAGPMRYVQACFPPRFLGSGTAARASSCCLSRDPELKRVAFVLADLAARNERLDDEEA